MKKILAVWCVIFFGFAPVCFGATPKANFIDPDYQLRYDGMYNRMGFGSVDAMWRFMSNRITRITFGVYQENGTGGFNDAIYRDYDPYLESLEEAVLRIANYDFNRIAALRGYRMNQKFSLKFYFSDAIGPQFITQKASFTPVLDGTVYKVPNSLPSELVLAPSSGAGGTQIIHWPGIKRAALVVFDSTGKLVFKGDSLTSSWNNTNFYVTPKLDLTIARRFLTNGYTGVLTVVLNDGTSGSYSLSDGRLLYPNDNRPYVGITMTNGVPSLEIFGGASGAYLTLRKIRDLNCPWQAETESITLNEVGSATWTGTNNSLNGSNVQFFSVEYDE